jgi:hemerythrin-like domain-containing protein
MTDVVDLIMKDHREVELLFGEFEALRDAAVADRICDELTKHTHGEETAVYPVIARRLTDGQQLSSQAVREHEEAHELIVRVRATSDGAHLTQLTQLMTELKDAIQHHVQEEEAEMLPQARLQLSTGELEDMARDFEQAKEVAPERSG